MNQNTPVLMLNAERCILGLAALMAIAIWLPWPAGTAKDGETHRIAFAGRDDPAANVVSLVRRSLLDVASVSAATSNAAAASPVDMAERLVLRGLARVAETDVAVFEDRNLGRFVRVQRGQDVGGWHLVGVVENQAVLKNQAGEERKLSLVVNGR